MGEAIQTVGTLAGICGYDGSDWQKAGLPLWFSDTVAEEVVDTNLPVTSGYVYGSAVPAGEVWVVTACAGRYDGTTATRLFVGEMVSSVGVYCVSQVAPATTAWYGTACNLVLKEGDKMIAGFLGTTAGDNGYLRYAGYKVALSM